MARTTALDVLIKYQNEQSYLNITLNDYLEKSLLSRNDKDLATRIVYGTIQNKLYLEYQLAPYIQGKKIKNREKMILLMSLYQLIFLDKVPDYAVIDEAVRLAKKRDNFAGKFVNAILRNFLRNGKCEIDEKDELKRISIETSHPLWIVKMLSKQYDLNIAKKICQHDNTPPTRAARVNILKTTKAQLLTDENFEAGNLSPDGLLYRAGNIANTDYFKNGLVTIQDESSQLIAPLLDPQPTDLVLDMCCAPGSKTTHLAAIMNNQGKIIAYDLFEHKIKLVEANLKRLGVNNHDSGAMDTIIPLQAKLLDNAYYLLKKNGKMIYSTCTINKKENEQMIKQFLDKYPDMKIIEEKKILPYVYDSDGFYMCKLEKGK